MTRVVSRFTPSQQTQRLARLAWPEGSSPQCVPNTRASKLCPTGLFAWQTRTEGHVLIPNPEQTSFWLQGAKSVSSSLRGQRRRSSSSLRRGPGPYIRNVHRNEFRASERESTPPLTRLRRDCLLRTEGSSCPLRKEQSWTPKEYNFHMAKEVITFINCFFESLQFAKQFRSENGFLQREACGIRSKCKHIRTPLLASPHTHLQSLSRFALSQSKGQAFFQLLFWGPRALGVACIGLIKAGRMPLSCTASYISGNMVSCQIQEVRLGRNRVFQTYFYKQNSQRRSLRRTRSCHYLRGR